MITSLSELVQRVVRKAMDETRVSMPAKIISYDAKRRMASVQIMQPEMTRDGRDIGHPVIVEVPVSMPIGGGAALTFPIKPGDEGIVLFADQDIGGYARDGDMSKPESNRRHSLTDAMFTPGMSRGAAHSDNVEMSFGGSKITIEPSGQTIIDAAGGASITLEPGGKVLINAPGGLEITGSGVEHNGVNISETHVHGGILPGPGNTAVPQ